MYRKTALFVLILAGMMMCGCAALQQFVQAPTVSFKGVSLQDMSLIEGNMLFRLNVTNPNPIGATVRNVAYNLKLNGREFLKNTVNKKISLPAGGSSMVELPVTINYLDFFQSVAEFIESDQVAYDLSGSVGIGPLTVPYQTSGNLDIPKLPEISLENVAVSNLSLTGVSLIFSLNLENQNPFTVNLTSLNYGIKLGGIQFARGTAKNVSPIGGNSGSVMEIPLKMNFFEVGRSVYGLLTRSSSEYEMTGEMKFQLPEMGEKSFPFQTAGKVSFDN